MAGITFGASGLDRAAHLRRPEAQKPGSAVLPIWRGKPAMDVETGSPLWLDADHAVFKEAREPAIFLGLDTETPRFARDISSWDAGDAAPIGGFLDPSVQVHPAMPKGTGFLELRATMTTLTARDAELLATAKALTTWHANHQFCAKCGSPSVSADSGWMRHCEVCGTNHFPRTDPVVIMLVTHGNDLLLGRSPGWPEGMYSLLAGFVEPGETIEAAAAREVFEESGVRLGAVRYEACQPWPFPSSLMIGVSAEAETREINIDPTEIDDAIWLPREDVLETISGTHPKISAARRGAIARTLIEDWLGGRIAP